jgi:DNA topoisomerase-1
LDAIATGQQDWQIYLTSWYREYFAPALEQARAQLSTGAFREVVLAQLPQGMTPAGAPTTATATPSRNRKADKTLASALPAARSAKSKGTPQKSKVKCPTCGETMNKIPSRSQKLKANHFLKCGAPGCSAVMFWNPKKKGYELPYRQQPPDPEAFTDYPCPSCGALLERYSYQKDGKAKVMLRCSLLENRRGKCKEVAFFESRDGFWSPKFGTLKGAGDAADR